MHDDPRHFEDEGMAIQVQSEMAPNPENRVRLGEELDAFRPKPPEDADQMLRMRTAYGRDLVQEGRRLIHYSSGAMGPMPKSTASYIEKCERYDKA